MQQLANLSSNSEIENIIGSDTTEILRFYILESGSTYACLPDHSNFYKFKAIDSPLGKEQIFQVLKAKFNGSHYLWHGSRLDRWFSIAQKGLIDASKTKLMSVGSTFENKGATCLSYSSELENK